MSSQDGDAKVKKTPMNPILKAWANFVGYLSENLLGGPRIKFCIPINIQKGGTAIFVLALMHHFDNWGPSAQAYLALHGSYGLAWLLKEAMFPDPKWQKKVTIPGAIASWAAVLGPYWVMPYLLISSKKETPTTTITVATMTYALGLLLMIGSDCQKYFVLQNKRGLITDGFFSRIRHPNYLGEMMIYGSFAAVSGRWESWAILAWVWAGVFFPNIMGKEESMSRYPQWAAYRKRTGYLFPKLFVGK